MITNTIRAQYGGPSQDTFIYSKPYTKRLDNLRMPTGYQPPKFMQFDGKDEPVVDYINRWQMCIQCMHWGLLYILQGIKPRTFEELTTRAHDIELSIANHDVRKEMVSDHQNDKSSRNGADSLRTRILESMTISATPMKISTRGKKDARKAKSTQDQEPR
ncbi:hypothetical protein L3X38_023540 [Prunus dulcis]|uniref:Uncharacterized protein n=1 Tax=Prunus dulcis TaxID=3755 RepID=A0AAD4VZN7_PRUDU|nr:hypothetical protein L3X38_023540 [Prunus dulcis]